MVDLKFQRYLFYAYNECYMFCLEEHTGISESATIIT